MGGILGAIAARRITVVLDADHSEKLALRAGAGEEPLAETLLAGALDNADPEPERLTALLDRIPGALDRAREGSSQAAADAAILLDEL